jgi:membrane protease subunit HflK
VADAQAYANDIVPKAQSAAQRQLTDAQVYAAQTRAAADGEAQRFTQLAQAYARAPEITRTRMYIDTVENILSHAHKIILDTKSGTGNTIYLPLDKLAEAIRSSAPATPATASAPTPPPAAGAAPSTAADASEDARDRERPQR